jgi:dihydrolipoamide dehydrogenase
VKFIADAETDELLGCHIMGANASDLIQEVVLAFEYRGSSEDIGITVHSHPTLSEAVKEAALAVLGAGDPHLTPAGHAHGAPAASCGGRPVG